MQEGFERCDNTKDSLVLAARVAAMEGARIMIRRARKPVDDDSSMVRELEEEILIARVRSVRIKGQKNVDQPFRRMVILAVDAGTLYLDGRVSFLTWDPESPDEAVVFFVAEDSAPRISPLTVTFSLQ